MHHLQNFGGMFWRSVLLLGLSVAVAIAFAEATDLHRKTSADDAVTDGISVGGGASSPSLPSAAAASSSSRGVFCVLRFGAVGDGRHDDTVAIRAALSAADAAGGGVVLLPSPGTYRSGSLHMASNTIFRVERGATLSGSTLYEDYPYEWIPGGGSEKDTMHRQSLIAGAKCAVPTESGCGRWERLKNVTLDGGGIIDGRGQAWWWANDAGNPAAAERPALIQPALVDGLAMHDLTFRSSPMWTIHPLLCTNVRASRITVESGQFSGDREYEGHNVDGFDPDSCINVTLEDSVISAGDDCVAIYSLRGRTRNVLVRNVTCRTPLSITHGNYGTTNVTFDNCTVRGDWGHSEPNYQPRWWKTALRIKSDRMTNGTVQNVTYRNLRAVGVDLLFDIQMWYPCQNQSGAANYEVCRSYYPVVEGIRPHIRNVALVNVTADKAYRTGWLNCLPESPCVNVSLEGIRVDDPTGTNGWACEHVRGRSEGGNSPVVPSATACFESSRPEIFKGAAHPIKSDKAVSLKG